MLSKISTFLTDRIKSTGHVLFVVFAFVIMIVSSYIYTSRIVRNHLLYEAEITLSYAQSYIEADLLEPKTTLASIAESIRHMILDDADYESVTEFITNITGYMRADEEMMSHMMGVYAYFDCFDGRVHSGIGWIPGDDFIASSRPWYIAAVEANGKVGVTEPYLDLSMGLVAVSYAKEIYNNYGTRLGIIAVHIKLDRIIEYATNTYLTTESYGILLDRSLDVIAHPDPNYLGLSLYLLNDGEAIASDILDGTEFGIHDSTSYLGDRSLIFYKRLENDWILGIITPYSSYYRELRQMAWVISLIGLILAAFLSFFLLQLNRAKNKATERTQVMLDSMPMAAVFWNKNCEMIDCNLEAVRFFDLMSKQEFKDKFNDLSPEFQPNGDRSKDKQPENFREAFERGYNRFEWVHQNPNNGVPIPCEVTLIRQAHENEYIIASYTRDLRDEKKMIAQLQEEIGYRSDAEAANQAKTSFLATMSHEIRSPMNSILGITEIQLQNETLNDSVKEGLVKIHDAGYTLLHIINDMLDLSKIEAGKMDVKAEKYEIASLINDTVHMNIMRIGSKAIEFKLDVDESIPSILIGDELRIKQILNNLLSNAFKYTDVGTVSLAVSADCNTELKTVRLLFKITDTGRGMTEEQISKIFDEYTRFNYESKKVVEGVGLGMTIVQRLVNMMKGEIVVESEPDVGSVFTFFLPQEYDDPSPLGSEMVNQLKEFSFHGNWVKGADIVREHMPYGRVLIVDDVDTNIFVAKGFLSPYSLEIDTAESGFEAIDKIRSGNSYDIIFMDHMMPKMDGVETTKLIRLMGYKKPIVALTANALVGKSKMFLANGFDDFIAKPIDLRALNACLNKLIRDRKPPEVVNEARRMREADAGRSIEVDYSEMMESFTLDALKSVTTLEQMHGNGYRRGDDLPLLVVTISGIKTALLSIKEGELAEFAQRIENAGRENDITAVMVEMPLFLSRMKEFLK